MYIEKIGYINIDQNDTADLLNLISNFDSIQKHTEESEEYVKLHLDEMEYRQLKCFCNDINGIYTSENIWPVLASCSLTNLVFLFE